MVAADAPLWPADLDLDAELARLLESEATERVAPVCGSARSTSAELLAAAVAAGAGPDAIGLLSAIDPAGLTRGEALDYAAAWDRQASYVAARRWAAIGHVATTTPDADGGWLRGPEVAEAELAAELRLHPRSVRNDIDLAFDLSGRLAPAARALAAGTVSVAHVRVLAEELAACDETIAAAVQAELLPMAVAHGLPPSRLRRAARRFVLRLDADAARRRTTEVRAERGVTVTALPDDMGRLVWTSTIDEISLAKAILDRLSARPSDSDDERTADQRRSDTLYGIVLATWNDPDLPELPGRRAHRADITLSFETLTGRSDEPGELPGLGPVSADLARRIAGSAHLRFLVYDPATGRLLPYDPGTWTGRPTAAVGSGLVSDPGTWRPSAALQRHTDARRATCAGPGCDTRLTDHDHVHPFHSGGATSPDNQCPLCRRHHLLKTHAGWQLRLDRDGGATWTLPNGKTYYEPPDDLRPGR